MHVYKTSAAYDEGACLLLTDCCSSYSFIFTRLSFRPFGAEKKTKLAQQGYNIFLCTPSLDAISIYCVIMYLLYKRTRRVFVIKTRVKKKKTIRYECNMRYFVIFIIIIYLIEERRFESTVITLVKTL